MLELSELLSSHLGRSKHPKSLGIGPFVRSSRTAFPLRPSSATSIKAVVQVGLSVVVVFLNHDENQRGHPAIFRVHHLASASTCGLGRSHLSERPRQRSSLAVRALSAEGSATFA